LQGLHHCWTTRQPPLAWDRAASVDVICLGLVDDVDGRVGTGWWKKSNGIIRNPCLGLGTKVLLLVMVGDDNT
jgi:hypothetical protein